MRVSLLLFDVSVACVPIRVSFLLNVLVVVFVVSFGFVQVLFLGEKRCFLSCQFFGGGGE